MAKFKVGNRFVRSFVYSDGEESNRVVFTINKIAYTANRTFYTLTSTTQLPIEMTEEDLINGIDYSNKQVRFEQLFDEAQADSEINSTWCFIELPSGGTAKVPFIWYSTQPPETNTISIGNMVYMGFGYSFVERDGAPVSFDEVRYFWGYVDENDPSHIARQELQKVIISLREKLAKQSKAIQDFSNSVAESCNSE